MLRYTGPSIILLLLSPQLAGAEPAYRVGPDGIVAGRARFQPLSDKIIRMEYSATGRFVDTPTAVVVNRLKPVAAKVSYAEGTLTIETAAYRLRYKPGGGAFAPSNLKVSWSGGSWVPGQADARNLGGAPHSLDGVGADNLPSLGEGLLSRSGYWLLDDSAGPTYDPAGKWIAEKPQPFPIDEYLFVYGADFKGALREYTRLLGSVPLVPRFALGVWNSKWYDFTDRELKDVVGGYRSRRVPLDVLVIDAGWHSFYWEGYDWNAKCFPDPLGFLRWCHDRGLEVTLNNHPGNIPAGDTHVPAVRKFLGLPETGEGVDFNLSVQNQAEAYNKILHDPLIDEGVSFWWIDADSAWMSGLNSQLWTSKVYYTNQEEHSGKRSLIFARFGGIGSHRYPLGFSGDTFALWDVLRYETGMTAPAGNVLWQWSHDIGAFNGGKLEDELIARWTQFGAFSPVLRFHSNHGERLPWEYEPRTEKVMSDALRLRERLIPYAYSLQRVQWKQSLPVYRPLYLEYPNDDQAYQHPYEYLVGSDLLVAPASAPTHDGVTEVPVYLPRGRWSDYFTGRPIEGGKTFIYPAALEDIPLLARAGSIIPTQQDKLWDAEPRPHPVMTLRVYRGASGAFSLEEDDGVSLDYRNGMVASTKLSLVDSKDRFTFTVGPRVGTYAGAPSKRDLELLVFGATKPRSVTANGEPVGYEIEPGGALRVLLGSWPTDEAIQLKVENPGGLAASDFALRASALSRRIKALLPALRSLGRVATAFEDASAKLDADAADARVGRKAPYGLGELLLGLVGATRKAGAGDDLVAKVLDFRWCGELEHAEPFGFKDTLSAWASWDENLSSRAVRVDFRASREFDVLRVSTPRAGFGRWALKETARSRVGDFEAALSAVADLPGHPIVGTKPFNWSNAFVTQWKLLGAFPAMNPAADEPVFASGRPLDFSKTFHAGDGQARWVDFPENGENWKVMTPRFVDLGKVWDREQVHCYAATYLYSPDDRDVRFDIGVDDTFVLWVNRREAARWSVPQFLHTGMSQVAVKLKMGWNEVLMRVGNGIGGWGFYFEVKKPDGRAETDIRVSTTPQP